MYYKEIIHKYNSFIFDNDGVILDSNQAKTEAFAKSVGSYDKENIDTFIDYHVKNGGVSRFEKIDYFYREIMGFDSYKKELEDSLSIYASDAKRGMLEAAEIEGVMEFIKKIHQCKNSIYVISGSDEEELISIYTERGINGLFKKVKGGPNNLSSDESGKSLVPPSAGYESRYLRSDGTWVNPEHSHSNLSSTDHPHEFATLHDHKDWENNHDHDHWEKKSKHVNSNPYALNNHSHKHESSGNANFDGNNYYLNGNGGWTEVPSGGQDFGSLTKTGENMRFGNNRSWIDYGMGYSHHMYGHWGPWVEYATHCEKPYSHYICVKIYATRYNSPMFNIGSAGLTSASDKRLKENIKTIENALYKIKSIRGVYYKKKLKRTEDIARLELGVIAQEVQPYIPEIVVENMGEGKEDYLMVSYERLVPVLIEAVKELRKEKNIEVENMSNKIEETSKLIHEELDELEKENKEILNQMEELKKRINKLDKTYTMN